MGTQTVGCFLTPLQLWVGSWDGQKLKAPQKFCNVLAWQAGLGFSHIVDGVAAAWASGEARDPFTLSWGLSVPKERIANLKEIGTPEVPRHCSLERASWRR